MISLHILEILKKKFPNAKFQDELMSKIRRKCTQKCIDKNRSNRVKEEQSEPKEEQ